MKSILIFLLLIGTANAADLELSAGDCAYKGKGEGEWWLGTEFEKESAKPYCGQIGVKTENWRFAYTYLGRIPLHEIANGDGTSNPSHWAAIGHGEVQGLTIGPYWERRFGPVIGSAELGGMLYDSHWSATAYHYASQVNRTVKTPHRQGIAPYVGLGVSYPLTAKVSIGISTRYYVHVNFNRNDGDVSSGDNIGFKSANVLTRMIGLQVTY